MPSTLTTGLSWTSWNALLGPNLRYHNNKLNMKNPANGSAVQWHQDWAFYPHTNDSILEVGIALDDMTA